MLEARGLLKRIGVLRRPEPDDGLSTSLFSGEGLEMSIAFSAAYENAEASSRLYAQRFPAAGFLKTILLRRIGSALQRQRISQQVKHHAHPSAGVQFPLDGEPDREDDRGRLGQHTAHQRSASPTASVMKPMPAPCFTDSQCIRWLNAAVSRVARK